VGAWAVPCWAILRELIARPAANRIDRITEPNDAFIGSSPNYSNFYLILLYSD